MKGRKPTIRPDLRIIATGRRPYATPAPPPARKAKKATEISNGLQCPKTLIGRARKVWIALIQPCDWLTKDDAIKAQMFCDLVAQYEKSPENMPSSRLSVLRHLSTDLMETAKRTRVPATRPRARASRFFDDKESKYFD